MLAGKGPLRNIPQGALGEHQHQRLIVRMPVATGDRLSLERETVQQQSDSDDVKNMHGGALGVTA
eukprot:CAMPEP_0118853732 /NCGR_PEP_ID=MMETSP1163-20130328/2206_1 /TAXON_ID=124430 /ORGANISM="Phaeomonas parva, Strain CCMP2877" /LENGTH=64 /DNA_ID=CAMNT_0006786333 /DNA_START=1516 /DNA_END=1710 /DNA_ORIENTATION=-